MIKYRKKKGSDTWHWCTNCKDWPRDWEKYDEVTVDGRPKNGELDNKCRGYEEANNCSKG